MLCYVSDRPLAELKANNRLELRAAPFSTGEQMVSLRNTQSFLDCRHLFCETDTNKASTGNENEKTKQIPITIISFLNIASSHVTKRATNSK